MCVTERVQKHSHVSYYMIHWTGMLFKLIFRHGSTAICLACFACLMYLFVCRHSAAAGAFRFFSIHSFIVKHACQNCQTQFLWNRILASFRESGFQLENSNFLLWCELICDCWVHLQIPAGYWLLEVAQFRYINGYASCVFGSLKWPNSK